ncbi:hypothetical protein L1887_62134 [Cichorium endivia]|nr:hypothetical protein L1887_62134 [Cichorium endivia]
MQIALFDGGWVLGVRVEKLLDVSFGVVADTDALDEALVFGLLDGPPAVEPVGATAVGAMDEVEIDVSQATLFDRLGDAALGCVVAVIGLQLGAVKDVAPADGAAGRSKEARDGRSDTLLVVVPLCAVDALQHWSALRT